MLPSILCEQNVKGFWESKAALSKQVNFSQIPQDFIEKVRALINDAASIELVVNTLVAILVLKRDLEEQEDEWVLIAKKAKLYLKEQGIALPDALIRELKVALK